LIGREPELAQIAKTSKDFEGVWDDPKSDRFPHPFGEAAGFVSKIDSAETLMVRIVGEAEQLLRKRFVS
jgi:hypothetical protein